MADEDTPLRLEQWPNFTQLPHSPMHQRFAARLVSFPATARQIAESTQKPVIEVIRFLNACAVLDLVKVVPHGQRSSPAPAGKIEGAVRPRPVTEAQIRLHPVPEAQIPVLQTVPGAAQLHPLPSLSAYGRRVGVLRGLLQRLGIAA
jgi:hypothetical protein